MGRKIFLYICKRGNQARPRQGCQLCLFSCRGRQLRLLPRQGHLIRLLPHRGLQLCLLPRWVCQLRLLPCQGRQHRRSKNIFISCPTFRSHHVSGRVWNTKACVVIVECWGFFLAPHSMSNLTGGLLLKSIVIRGLLLDAIIFGGSFVTLVTWFNDFYLSQLSLEDRLDHLSPCKQEDLLPRHLLVDWFVRPPVGRKTQTFDQGTHGWLGSSVHPQEDLKFFTKALVSGLVRLSTHRQEDLYKTLMGGLVRSSTYRQEDLYFGLSIVGDFGFLSIRRQLWLLSFHLGDNFTLDRSLVGELSFLSTHRRLWLFIHLYATLVIVRPSWG